MQTKLNMNISVLPILFLLLFILKMPIPCEAGFIHDVGRFFSTYLKAFYPSIVTPKKLYSPDFELQKQLISQSEDLMEELVNLNGNLTSVEQDWLNIQNYAELRRHPKNIFAENTLGVIDSLSDVIAKMSLSSAFRNMEAPVVFLEPPAVAIKQESVTSSSPCNTCVGKLNLTKPEMKAFKSELKRIRRIDTKTLKGANKELLETESLAKETLQHRAKIINDIQHLSAQILKSGIEDTADSIEMKFLQSDLAMAEQRHAALVAKQKALVRLINDLSKK
ncbi:uncharacterized protein CMU_036250 [Cryptosporidium muris RN66]|uniref:Uncharacterized protein n=1 Tax=Cryptosporidium muris (strain RN66) TaxID=441375 RepID=B6AGW1_CRYMR|nr:uncharacterized protein CMU_036250 [Cryptosporidium muris RN66]EEA07452.1 hypothetical protein, conserved [Cryptosporidium muris RN66]|eukprot:XP_002141801.1 hypothetical protein [Cryptosporidium muris RN66]